MPAMGYVGVDCFTYNCFRAVWRRGYFGGIQHVPEFMWTWRNSGRRTSSMYDVPSAVAANPLTYFAGVGGLRWIKISLSAALSLLDCALSPGAALGVLYTLYTLYETQPRCMLQRHEENAFELRSNTFPQTTAIDTSRISLFTPVTEIASAPGCGPVLSPAPIRLNLASWQRLLRIVLDARRFLPTVAGDDAHDLLKVMCRRRLFSFGGHFGQQVSKWGSTPASRDRFPPAAGEVVTPPVALVMPGVVWSGQLVADVIAGLSSSLGPLQLIEPLPSTTVGSDCCAFQGIVGHIPAVSLAGLAELRRRGISSGTSPPWFFYNRKA